MQKYTKILLSVLSLISMLLFPSCSPTAPDDHTGTGTETENVALISGYIYNEDGTPAKGAKVYFVTSDHQPSLSKRLAIFTYIQS